MGVTKNEGKEGSSEVEAWKLMMKNMVRFIDASTTLMQSITEQASESCGPDNEACPRGVPECEICRITKKPAPPETPGDEKKEEGTDPNSCCCKRDRKSKCNCAEKGGPCGGAEMTHMCSCEMGPVERKNLAKDLSMKLREAEEQLTSLQKEMRKLKAAEHPSAALYKHIMKDDDIPLDVATSVRSVGPSRMPPSGRGRPKVCDAACQNKGPPRQSLQDMQRPRPETQNRKPVRVCYNSPPEGGRLSAPIAQRQGAFPPPLPQRQGQRQGRPVDLNEAFIESDDEEEAMLCRAGCNDQRGPRATSTPIAGKKPQYPRNDPNDYPRPTRPTKGGKDFVNSSFTTDSQMSFSSGCSADSCGTMCYRKI